MRSSRGEAGRARAVERSLSSETKRHKIPEQRSLSSETKCHNIPSSRSNQLQAGGRGPAPDLEAGLDCRVVAGEQCLVPG